VGGPTDAIDIHGSKRGGLRLPWMEVYMSSLTRIARRWALLLATALACQPDGPTSPAAVRPGRSPRFVISDGAHAGGNTHFYFLPPLVPPPTPSGAFDAALQPVVDIATVTRGTAANAPLVSFTTTAGGSERVRVDAEQELYIVNWHTKSSGARDGLYRISVRVGATLLGYVDVQLGGAAETLGADGTDDVDWKGGTIAIKFRIEQGALHPSKPVWKFSIRGAISKATADYLGGFEAATRFMRAQIDTINSRFNTPNVFVGEFRFSLDSIAEYTGTGWDEITKAHAGFDYKYIVDGYQGPGGWLGDYDVVFLSWPIAEITTPGATDAIVHEFGHARGAIDTYGIKADGEFNPVNGASYHPGRSIMDYPYGETVWDQHSINLINRSADVVHAPPSYITEAFPNSIGIVVSDASGVPQPNAKITLYPVPWFQNRVDPNPRYVVYTNEQGEYVFPRNPFDPGTWGSPWLMSYPNYLVTASVGTLSAFGWMPITDVQNIWFSDPTSPYQLRIVVRPTP
jgi:hypothetical protein